MPINAAASRPADGEALISEVMRYDATAVNPENPGARRTHMLRISTGIDNSRRMWYITPLVTMSPGYRVPPVTRPRGCHVPESEVYGQPEGPPFIKQPKVHAALIALLYHRKSNIGLLTVVEPIPEAVEPMLYQVLRRSKIEPGVNWRIVNVGIPTKCTSVFAERNRLVETNIRG